MTPTQAGTVGTPASRKRGPKPRFTREEIARVALEVADQGGLEALTMQRLAERLGIGTMTLYGYFATKDELLGAVIEAAVEPTELPSTEGGWQDQMRSLVGVAHRTLTRHPALVQIRFREPILRPYALRFGERVMGILRAGGFDAAEAASAFRLIFTYTFGFAGLSPARSTEQARWQAAVAAGALPEEEFPNLTATAAEWTQAMAGADQFAYGLDRILDGLQARLDSRGTPRGAAGRGRKSR
jgi:AcrR family transcriptional regulator